MSFLLNGNSSIFTDKNELLLIGAIKDIVEVESRIDQIYKNLGAIDNVGKKSTIADLQSSSPFVSIAQASRNTYIIFSFHYL